MIGDPASWLRRYRTVDTRMVACVAAVWPGCVARLPAQPDEDTITIQLVDMLRGNPGSRRLGTIVCQFPPFGHRHDGIAYSKGRIDMAVVLDRSCKRYLAYECKRLNVVLGGRRRSLAAEYVMEGILRFITEQYAESLPVGCMLGYVMDGDISFARRSVLGAIRRRRPELGFTGLASQAGTSPSMERFVSAHVRRSGAAIEVRHTLLPFREPMSAEVKYNG